MGKRTNTAKWVENRQRWQVNVQKDGRRKTFTSSIPGRNGQREANAKADAWLDDGVISPRTNLSKLFPEYLAALKLRTSRDHWANVEHRWRRWAEPVIGRVKPDNLTDKHLQDVIDKAYAKGKLSKKSLTNIRADLTSFVKYLRKAKLTTYHPEDIIIPKGARVGIRRILQPEDIITLFAVDTTMLRGKRVYDKFINAYRYEVLTGLRPGELMGLMPNDIRGTQVELKRSINTHGEITTGKNENAVRGFTMTITAKNVLDDQLAKSPGIYIFDISSEQTFRKRWKRYCECNGIPYVSPYEMRHTFVSVVQALPEGWVKSLVGHSKNMDTFGVYGHAVVGQQDQIAASVEGVFRDILMGGK